MRLKIVSSIIFVVTLGFGLWPLDFSGPNQVRWDENESALEFHVGMDRELTGKRGIAYSVDAFDASSWNEISIVMEIKGRAWKGGLGMILEVYNETSPEHPALKIAQWQNHLAVRSGRIRSTVERGYSEIGYRNCISDTDYTRILISSNQRGTTIHCTGMEPLFNRGFRLLDVDRSFVGQLVLGNGPEGENPFLGSIRTFEVYNTALSIEELESELVSPIIGYDFSSFTANAGGFEVMGSGELPLSVPTTFDPLDRRILHSPSFSRKEDWAFQKDVLINVFGFMPLGFCVVLLVVSKRRTGSHAVGYILSVVICFAVSFAIEVTQGFLVARDSSQLDLILNTLGGASAVILAKVTCRTMSMA